MRKTSVQGSHFGYVSLPYEAGAAELQGVQYGCKTGPCQLQDMGQEIWMVGSSARRPQILHDRMSRVRRASVLQSGFDALIIRSWHFIIKKEMNGQIIPYPTATKRCFFPFLINEFGNLSGAFVLSMVISGQRCEKMRSTSGIRPLIQ